MLQSLSTSSQFCIWKLKIWFSHVFFSNQEVEYSEEPGNLYFIKYRVAGGTRYCSLCRLCCIETFHYSLFDCQWTFHYWFRLCCHQILVHYAVYVATRFLFPSCYIQFFIFWRMTAWCTTNLLLSDNMRNQATLLTLYIDENCLQIFHLYLVQRWFYDYCDHKTWNSICWCCNCC
jgi:hypothetical protein